MVIVIVLRIVEGLGMQAVLAYWLPVVALKLFTFTLAATGSTRSVLVPAGAARLGTTGAGTVRAAPDLHHRRGGRRHRRDVYGRRDCQPRRGDVGETPVVKGDPPLHLAVVVLGRDDLALAFFFRH